MKRDRTLRSHRLYKFETLPLNHTALITQVVHSEDPYIRQPCSMTRVEGWYSSHSLTSPLNNLNRQMSKGTRTMTQGTAFMYCANDRHWNS